MPPNQRFEKSAVCPTNESLLAFLQADQNDLSAEEMYIVEHLGVCEFCELTLELLRATPAISDLVLPPPVPEGLRSIFRSKRVHK
jgi:hypothetical protein